VRTEDMWAKGIRQEGVREAVVGMVMNPCVLLKTELLFIVVILTVIMERISKVAPVLSVLMKVYTIPCHDRSH
jgi:hypothetical protein